MTGLDVSEHLSRIEVAMTLAEGGEGFGRMEPATAAAAQMVAAEERALRPGKGLQHGAHFRFRADGGTQRCVWGLAKYGPAIAATGQRIPTQLG